MPEIRIIQADFENSAHARAIVEIVNAYAQEPHGGGKPLPVPVQQSLVTEMRKVPGAVTLLAWDQDEAVGAAVCFLGFSSFAGRPLINVHDLSVIASHRGQGIGSQLLNAVEEHARQKGCCKVTLEVRDANPDAGRLYRRLGFGPPDGFPTRFLDKRL